LVSVQDIAIYGGLCALATFSRAELKTQVIDNANFNQFLEATPVIQSIISDFYKSKYSSCFSSLARLSHELELDVHLHSHTKRLLSSIRHKAILQYFSPFASVSLANMAKAFNTDVPAIEKEVASIISAGHLAARIDSHSKVWSKVRIGWDARLTTMRFSLSLSLCVWVCHLLTDSLCKSNTTTSTNVPKCLAPC
jgi:COP9 signalosome complex subunit 1